MSRHSIDLKAILAEVFNIEKEKVSIDSDNKTLKEWDSLSHVSLMVKLEEIYNVKFEAFEVARATSVKSIIDILKEKTDFEQFGF